MYLPDYLAGILSLPPSNGQDTTAPFFRAAPEAISVPPITTGKDAAVLTNAPTNADGVTGVLASNTPAASTSVVSDALGISSAPWYVQGAQYAGLALLAVALIAVGLFILVQPSASRAASAAGV